MYYLYLDRTELANTKLYFVGNLNNVSYIVEKLSKKFCIVNV